MARAKTSIFENLDWILILLYLLLAFLGWLNIYAATYNEEHHLITDLTQSYGKQMMWILLALVIATIILFFDQRFFEVFSYPLYGLALLLLIGVLVFGTEIKGAKSWYTFGGFSLQPSEVAKYATALALSKFLSRQETNLARPGSLAAALGIMFLPPAFIMLQPDVGSVLVYMSLFIVLYRQGLSGWIFIIAITAVVLFVMALLMKTVSWQVSPRFVISGLSMFISGLVLTSILIYYFFRKYKGIGLIVFTVCAASIVYYLSVDYVFDNFLKPHHQNRINELLGIVSDPKGAGYNVHQSKIAIGSGGFSGKGFLQGTQTKFNFVPEQSTDFIFCTVGEEWGFIGSFVVISLFLCLFARIIWRAEQQRSAFTRVYGYCVASILFFHFAVNIAMTIGLAPVIGIPLPFFSYGGSSLWAFTLLLFTFIKLDSERKYVLR